MRVIELVIRLLRSPILVITVLILDGLMALTGALLDSDLAKEYWQNVNSGLIFGSSSFLIINVILLLSAAACTIKQFRNYQVRIGRHNLTMQQKLGFLGSPILHIGLVIMLLSITLGLVAGFKGTVALRPGVLTDLGPQNYVSLKKGPLALFNDNPIQMLLHNIDLKYYADGVGSSGVISFIKGGILVSQSEVNRNNGMSLGLVSLDRDNFGYYVVYHINIKHNSPKQESAATVARLNTIYADDQTSYSRMEFQHPQSSYRLSMDFLPDAQKSGGSYVIKGYELKNAVLKVTVSDNEQQLFTGWVKPGSTVALKDGNRFTFSGVQPYLMIRVQWQLDIYILITGFLVFLTGLILIYFVNPSARYKQHVQLRREKT